MGLGRRRRTNLGVSYPMQCNSAVCIMIKVQAPVLHACIALAYCTVCTSFGEEGLYT